MELKSCAREVNRNRANRRRLAAFQPTTHLLYSMNASHKRISEHITYNTTSNSNQSARDNST